MNTVVFRAEWKDGKKEYSYVADDKLRSVKGEYRSGLRLFNYSEPEKGKYTILVRHIPLKEKLEKITRKKAEEDYSFFKIRGYIKYTIDDVSYSEFLDFKNSISNKLTVNQCYGTAFAENDKIVILED